MEKGIVKIDNNDLVVGTWDLAKGFDVAHKDIKHLIEKYKSEFEEFGDVRNSTRNEKNEREIQDTRYVSNVTSPPQKTKKKSGGQVKEFVINLEQYIYLGTLLKNTDKVRKFKRDLTKEFFRMRKVLIKLAVQHQNEEWHAKRAAGIVERRVETDAIKDFIEYAKAQGSQNANKYYMIISKMENASLLHLELINQKFENHRDMVDGFDLDALKMADKMVAQAIAEGMQRQMHYKDIYQIAKDRVEGFALAIGRTPMRLLKDKR